MAQLNYITLKGNTGSNVSLRMTKSGKAVANVNLAAKVQGATLWVKLTFWGSDAEEVAQRLGKGSFIQVEGEIGQQVWQRDGVEQSQMVMTVRNFKVLVCRPVVAGHVETVVETAPVIETVQEPSAAAAPERKRRSRKKATVEQSQVG